MKSKRVIPAQVQPVVSSKTYLENIVKVLENLCIKMEIAKPTNICFGFDPQHISKRGKIKMCLNYIEEAIGNYKS